MSIDVNGANIYNIGWHLCTAGIRTGAEREFGETIQGQSLQEPVA